LKWFLLKYLTKDKDKLIKDEECTKEGISEGKEDRRQD
jgi:hypothetical protein